MLSRIPFARLFRSRPLLLLGALGTAVLGLSYLRDALREASLFSAVAPALMGTISLVVAGFLAALAFVEPLTQPVTDFFTHLFHPKETLTAPPADLLFALRMRLRDRLWESVEQQTSALLDAYGPSPELFHLRAHLAAGRDGEHASVDAQAAAALKPPELARYRELLRSDPPLFPPA